MEANLLAREGLVKPDGRPLFAWNCDEEQRRRLAQNLALAVRASPEDATTATRFVLWAAEEIRTHHTPGHLTWEWLFGRLGRAPDGELGRDLTERGLAWWRREVRVSQGGKRQLLYSLMAEGGLPDAYLAEAPRYRSAVLAMLAEIEAEGALGEAAAERVAWRRVADLPHAFRHRDTVLLFSELSLGLARLRARLPADLPIEAAEAWLDRQVPGWRRALPLRLSSTALKELIRPALRAARGEAARPQSPLCRRELRRLADGGGWAGYAVVGEGALLAARFLPGVAADLRLRLLALGEGASPAVAFLGVPEKEGWRLMRAAGEGEAAVRLAPDQALLLPAYADGWPVGEAVLDAGIPPPELVPSFWRARDPDEETPTRLEPLSGGARTRAAHLWLLAGYQAEPIPGEGVTVEKPEPAPGGRLWPVSGVGAVSVAGCELRIATGAENEEPSHRLHIFGRLLPGWRCEDGQLPFLGRPEFWGAEGYGPLRPVTTGVSTRAAPRRLAGQIAEWRSGGEVAARAAFCALPEGLRLRLVEFAAGAVRLDAEGLLPDWHANLMGSGAEVAAPASAEGHAALALTVPGEGPALLRLRLSDPGSGAALTLLAPWPARRGMIVAPEGVRPMKDQTLAVGALGGWRGIVPAGQVGTLLLRSAHGLQLGLPVVGEVRLVAAEPLARLTLGLQGLDAELRLHLVVGGDEGRRLTLKRYAEVRAAGGRFQGGTKRWRLHAVALDPPGEVRTELNVTGDFDFAIWLSDSPALWLIQARSESGEVARPTVWSAEPRPFSTRESRILRYADRWRGLLDAPGDPSWDGMWRLIRAVREGGDAGALDQVQALGEVPAAAVALLLRVSEPELLEALALEAAAPLWWPATPLAAWAAGVAATLARHREALLAAGFGSAEAADLVGQALARRAGALLALRPELRGHLWAGFRANALPPFAFGAQDVGGVLPLACQHPAEMLAGLAHEVARRDPPLPEGAAGLRPARRSLAAGLPDHLRPLLDAPLVTAEMAAGAAPSADLATLFRLIALRQADPYWFDTALPVAIQLCLEDAPA